MGIDNFDIFRVKYLIEFEIETITPLSIKSGREFEGPVDNPVIRIKTKHEVQPYIPGSSLKGLLRSEAERIAKVIFTDPKDVPCNIFNPKEEKERKETAKKNGKEYVPCIICRLFGGPENASHVYVYDAYPKDEKNKVNIRNRVSLNRVLVAAFPGRLFSEEYVPPLSVFEGNIIIDNIDILDKNSKEARLFNLLMKLLIKGELALGSGKSIGYGNISIRKDSLKVTKYTINKEKFTIDDREVTREYLKLLEEF